MPCLYPYYVETFFAAGAATRRNDEQWLASIRAEAQMLEVRHAQVAELAIEDVARGAPLRARSHLCSAFVSEECTRGTCPNPHGVISPAAPR